MNELTELIDELKILQREVRAEERLDLWNDLRDDYCKMCGYDDPDNACDCWNDE